MESIYVIVENGQAYPDAHRTYQSAVKAVNDKYIEVLKNQTEENPEETHKILGDVNPPEDPSGQTLLYVEKQIYITIYKLRVC